jgi:hypothetical protein
MTTDKEKGNHFHLLFEKLGQWSTTHAQAAQPQSSPGFSEYLEIPNRGGYLTVKSKQSPRLVKRFSGDLNNLFVIQPLWEKSPPRLFILSSGNEYPLINGVSAPPVALLHIKDEILFTKDCKIVGHVSLYIRPRIGSPPVQRIGKKCPICRSEFKTNCITYTCLVCSQVVHCEGTGISNDNGLNCAEISKRCPTCKQPIYRDPGYIYFPEFLQV